MGCSSLPLKELPSVIESPAGAGTSSTQIIALPWDANFTSAVLDLYILHVIGEEAEEPQWE